MSVFCDNCGKENRDVAKFCTICGNRLSQPVVSFNGPLPAGTKLDNRYTIIDLIKAGGMGAVYKASYDTLHKICAVKELLPPYGKKEEHEKATEWFKRETQLLAKLDHPSLPEYVDSFICYGRYYLVMNFIEGEDLERKLKKEGNPGLPEKKIVEWAKQVLDVLDYLHTQSPPIIYRDIKPGNIMINNTGKAVLIDFGIARVSSKYSGSQKTAIGTAGYAPAEQCRGEAEPRSDLYALGATMHHLLTGVEPIPFKFAPPRKIMPTLSVEVERVIMKALREEPRERYMSAKEMYRVLSTAQPVRITSKLTRPVTTELRRQAKKVWEFMVDGPVTSSPCVWENCVYFGSYDKKLYCLDARNGNKIWDFDTGAYTFSSSPCIAQGLVYYGSGNTLYCIEARTGEKLWSFDTVLGFQSNPCISHGFVYFGSNDKKLYCLKSRDGSKLWDFTTGNVVVSSPYVQKGSVYFGSDDYNFYCLDTKEGKKIWDFKTGGMVKSSPYVFDGSVYFGSNDKNLYCLDIKSGEKTWDFQTGSWILSSPSAEDEYIYFGSDDKKFYCLEAKTGKKIWDFCAGDKISSSPCIAEGFIYFGSSDKKLYCLNARTGVKSWEFETGGDIWSRPCIVNGLIYFGSNDRKLYCLDTGRAGTIGGNPINVKQFRPTFVPR